MLRRLIAKTRRSRFVFGETGMRLQILFVIFAFAAMVIVSYIFMSRNEYAHLKRAEEIALDIKFIDTSKITEYAFNLSISDDSYGLLMDSRLNILVHPNREFLGKPLRDIGFDSGIIFDAINAGETNISELFITNYKGERCILSGRRLDNGWYLAIITPEAAYYRGIRYIAIVLIAIGASMALILSVILMRLTGDRNKAFNKIKEQNRIIVDSINYASRIQRNLLPPDTAMANAFRDYSVVWEPRDVVGGDIYWMKRFERGAVLCVCDCTGHGTPGALLTMLVVSALEAIVWPDNCGNTADIVYKLDRRLSAVLHVKTCDNIEHGILDIRDGCDIAVLFIANDGMVQFSSGNIPVFICNGNDVTQYRGQKLFIGEGKLESSDDVIIQRVPKDAGNKVYVASDGLFDQPGGEAGRQFGYRTVKQIIFENHHEKLSVITDKVWEAFEEHRGDQARRDDFELVAFAP